MTPETVGAAICVMVILSASAFTIGSIVNLMIVDYENGKPGMKVAQFLLHFGIATSVMGLCMRVYLQLQAHNLLK